MSYLIDFLKLAKEQMPKFLVGDGGESWVTAGGLVWVTALGQSWFSGGNVHSSWLKSCLAPLQSLNNDLLEFIGNIRYRMNLTGQVIYLEHYLNDLFDSNERRIFISDSAPIFSSIIYNKDEDEVDLVIYNKSENETNPVIYNKAELANQNDFVINVPSVIQLNSNFLNHLGSAVNIYKQAGSRYTVQSF